MPETHAAISDIIAIPQTVLALAAKTAMESVLPPKLFQHSMRTFFYGRAWARKRDIAFDEEGLFVASLFHDAGLCPPFKDTRRAFQLNSARALGELLHERGVEPERRDRLQAAVHHHLQPVPRWRRGPESGLLHIGAYMDVMALRAWRVRAERRVIREAYPLAASLMVLRMIVGSIRGLRSCLGIILPKLFDEQ
jgi:hypothetical protein